MYIMPNRQTPVHFILYRVSAVNGNMLTEKQKPFAVRTLLLMFMICEGRNSIVYHPEFLLLRPVPRSDCLAVRR
jgi:hypothetical protein